MVLGGYVFYVTAPSELLMTSRLRILRDGHGGAQQASRLHAPRAILDRLSPTLSADLIPIRTKPDPYSIRADLTCRLFRTPALHRLYSTGVSKRTDLAD